ncbi:MAG: hypothetical protein J0L73_21975 [Verrucomicrobia bacterium]|nr:hypothetical protein [Verrucomicrobiota bacterium]
MTTSGFNDQAAMSRFSAICWALLGFYLLGTGLYDLLIDQDSFELSRGTQILATWEADKTRFLVAVAYRLLLGAMFTGIAFVFGRLHRRNN